MCIRDSIFTGGLGLILNIIVIAYGACTGKGTDWFYGSATGLLFAFTYLYSAINTIFDFDQRLYGWFSLFVAINTIPAGILCLTSGYGGNAWYGIIWFLWGCLLYTSMVVLNYIYAVPLYAKFANFDIAQFIGLYKYLFAMVVPFNLLEGLIFAVAFALIYAPLKSILVKL